MMSHVLLMPWIQSGNTIPTVIEALLSLTKTNSTPLQLIALIDVAVSVLIRLKNDKRPPVERLSEDLKVQPLLIATNF